MHQDKRSKGSLRRLFGKAFGELLLCPHVAGLLKDFSVRLRNAHHVISTNVKGRSRWRSSLCNVKQSNNERKNCLSIDRTSVACCLQNWAVVTRYWSSFIVEHERITLLHRVFRSSCNRLPAIFWIVLFWVHFSQPYCLVTFLPGQIRWSVRFPSTPLMGLI